MGSLSNEFTLSVYSKHKELKIYNSTGKTNAYNMDGS